MAERVRTRPVEAQRGDGAMKEAARVAKSVHRQAMPEAEPLRPDPFAEPVVRGLWMGVVIGAILGIIFGVLLRRHVIVVPRWEMLFSMFDATYVTFWALMGVALGGVIGGIVALLVTPMRRADGA